MIEPSAGLGADSQVARSPDGSVGGTGHAASSSAPTMPDTVDADAASSVTPTAAADGPVVVATIVEGTPEDTSQTTTMDTPSATAPDSETGADASQGASVTDVPASQDPAETVVEDTDCAADTAMVSDVLPTAKDKRHIEALHAAAQSAPPATHVTDDSGEPSFFDLVGKMNRSRMEGQRSRAVPFDRPMVVRTDAAVVVPRSRRVSNVSRVPHLNKPVDRLCTYYSDQRIDARRDEWPEKAPEGFHTKPSGLMVEDVGDYLVTEPVEPDQGAETVIAGIPVRNTASPPPRLVEIMPTDVDADFYRRHFLGHDHVNFVGTLPDGAFASVSLRRRRGQPGYSPDDQRRSSTVGGDGGAAAAAGVDGGEGLATGGGSDGGGSGGGGGAAAVGPGSTALLLVARFPGPRSTIRLEIAEDHLMVGRDRPLLHSEALQALLPNVPVKALRQAAVDSELPSKLVKLDECHTNGVRQYKMGILHCRPGQTDEDTMYNNTGETPAFTSFLNAVGERVDLQGYEGYRGGLDVSSGHTGSESYVAEHEGAELMFHVSTLLPFVDNDEQQLQRKRHLGNDLVCVVFQEEGSEPLDPRWFHSKFQKVFVVVRPAPADQGGGYVMSVARQSIVPPFGPMLDTAMMSAEAVASGAFRTLFLTLLINAENACHRSPALQRFSYRVREQLLEDIVTTYTTDVPVDGVRNRMSQMFGTSGRKISLRSAKKKLLGGDLPKGYGDGASRWLVQLVDTGRPDAADVSMVISSTLLVFADAITGRTLHNLPITSVFGWVVRPDGVDMIVNDTAHVFEVVCADTDDVLAVTRALAAHVTDGHRLVDTAVVRSDPSVPWGFDVDGENKVVHVVPDGPGAVAGLTEGMSICMVNMRFVTDNTARASTSSAVAAATATASADADSTTKLETKLNSATTSSGSVGSRSARRGRLHSGARSSSSGSASAAVSASTLLAAASGNVVHIKVVGPAGTPLFQHMGDERDRDRYNGGSRSRRASSAPVTTTLVETDRDALSTDSGLPVPGAEGAAGGSGGGGGPEGSGSAPKLFKRKSSRRSFRRTPRQQLKPVPGADVEYEV
eukprot:m.188609 g.188609  ORF g.188609 m.188609 type:complete len:1072 (-) comp17494_c0_seq1:197-3412(-)